MPRYMFTLTNDEIQELKASHSIIAGIAQRFECITPQSMEVGWIWLNLRSES